MLGSKQKIEFQRKRSHPENEKVEGETEEKRGRPQWRMVVLGPKIKPEYHEDSDSSTILTDSTYSYQDRETEVARSTSDTESKTDCSVVSEYSVVMDSEDEDPLGLMKGGSSSSCSEDQLLLVDNILFINQNVADDLGLLADSSDTESDAWDPEIPRTDYWHCTQCKATQNNPRFRYCEQCYQARKLYFPPRPRPKERKKRSKKTGLAPSSANQDNSEATTSLMTASQSTSLEPSQTTTTSQESDDLSCRPSSTTLCQICCAVKANGIFTHRRTAHVNYACYQCAKTCIKRQRICPVCRRFCDKVFKVIGDAS